MIQYAIGVIFSLGIWCILFALLPKSRNPIIWSSFACGGAGPISQYWHIKDYWNPSYLIKIQIGDWIFGIEDYIFAFAFGGLCTGVFDFFIRRTGEEELKKFDIRGYIKYLLLCALCFFSMVALISSFGLNSLHASLIAFLVFSLFIFIQLPGLVLPAVKTSIVLGSYMWVSYWGFYFRLYPDLVEQWWKSTALIGIYLGGVPIEEIIWASIASLFIGPALRYCMHNHIP